MLSIELFWSSGRCSIVTRSKPATAGQRPVRAPWSSSAVMPGIGGSGRGDIGFLDSFTKGLTLDGPGVRVVAWSIGCQFRRLSCHNPDTWNMMDGMPVTMDRAVEQLSKYRHGL